MATKKKAKSNRINNKKLVNIDWLEKRLSILERRVTKSIEHIVDSRIEELAIMTQRSFRHVEDRFDKVEGRLDKHETVLAEIAHILEGIDLRLSQTAYKIDLDILADRVERIDKRISK